MNKIVIANLHKDTENEDYLPIRCDRQSPVGNPFQVNKNCDREKSISLYKRYFYKKIADPDNSENIEFMKYLRYIYKSAKKNNIKLLCWCYPLDCHTRIIKEFIEEQLEKNC